MKKCYLLITSFFLILFLMVQPVSAQDSTAIQKIKSFSGHFVAFSKSYPQEKVYLHFDNTSYYLGESIWFKAYTVRADRNSLSNISKILYVELLNAEGYVLETKKLKLENGACHGDFKLNTTNYGGFYEVRAYTRYMLNFGTAACFSRIFPVYDQPKYAGDYKTRITDRLNSQSIPNKRPDEPQKKEQLNLDFFPEGGNLVQQVTSKVAFKATNQHGEDAVITGSVFNDKNEKVLDINTDYQGMGSLEFSPDAGQYYARVTSNGLESRFNLPMALPTGYVLKVDNSTDQNLDVLIRKNTVTTSEPLGLSVSSRGVLYVFREINAQTENTMAFSIAKKLLPDGVAQITLYNASGNILAERLAFIHQQSPLKISVSQDKQAYQPFEEVKMDFLLADPQNKPVEATFSLSVRDGSTSSNNPYSNNLLTDLLLSSEIKGYIENPGVYFQVNDIAHQRALDLLLLTQGWTRYSWKQMAGITPFALKEPVEKQQVIDGNIASLMIKRKLKNVDVSMILLTDSTSQQGTCKTDSVGNFNFGLIDFNGNAKLILESKVNNKRKATRFMLNRQFMPEPQPYTAAALNMNPDFKILKKTLTTSGNDTTYIYAPKDQKNLSMSEQEHLLKTVTVKENRLPLKVSLKYDVVKEMDKIEDTGEWQPSDIYGFLNKTNKYVKTIPLPDGGTKITYKGKSIRFVFGNSNFFANEGDDDISRSGSNGSGMKGKNMNRFRGGPLLIDDIESVTIIEDYGTIVSLLHGKVGDVTNTVVALVIQKKNYHRDPNGIRNTTFPGYSYTREFFSPRYNQYKVSGEKDYRRTLYWNPDVKTDKEGRARVMFDNNSTCKEMSVSAETITDNGVIGALNE